MLTDFRVTRLEFAALVILFEYTDLFLELFLLTFKKILMMFFGKFWESELMELRMTKVLFAEDLTFVLQALRLVNKRAHLARLVFVPLDPWGDQIVFSCHKLTLVGRCIHRLVPVIHCLTILIDIAKRSVIESRVLVLH